jgi:hypothetical protein
VRAQPLQERCRMMPTNTRYVATTHPYSTSSAQLPAG